MTFGYMGKILIVDLQSQHIEIRELNLDIAHRFIGGLGLNTWLFKEFYKRGTDPLSPDNPLILGAGPLVGSGTPGAAKTIATTRFPLNGAISESVGSMRFAQNLKAAGFDHIVIIGKAKRPMVLCIEDNTAYLRDATSLWGADIFQTTDAIKKEQGAGKKSVIAIGPAGENLVSFSIALIDKASTLGRGGLGAVMGAKNLKAIIAKGSKRPKVFNRKELKKLLGGLRERLKRFKNYQRVLEFGIMENWNNYVKQLSPYRNFSKIFPPDKANKLYGLKVYKSFKLRRIGCPSCFTPDKDILEIIDGPYKGFKTFTTSYFNSYSVGHLFDLNTEKDKTAAVRMTDTLDRLGIDMLSFGAILDFLISECENGNLDVYAFKIPLKREMDIVLEFAHSISNRKIEILPDGWKALFTYLGNNFESHMPIIKDCDIIWDPRLCGLGTMEFEQIVSLKGPRSASGGSPTYIPGQPEENLPLFQRHLDRMGADSKAIARIMDSPFGFNVGRMTRYAQDWYTLLSSLGICNRHFINRFYSFDLCHRLFQAVTGAEVEHSDIRKSLNLIWDTLKRMNLNEGSGPSDDRAPEFWFSPMEGPDGEELMIRDYFGKSELKKEDISSLIEDYYEERGWKNGIPDKTPDSI